MDGQFGLDRRLIYLKAVIVGPWGVVRVDMALDTGARRSSLRPDFFRRAGFNLARPTARGRLTSATDSVPAPLFRVPRLICIGVERTGLLLAAQEYPVSFEGDGLLGLDFIRPGPLHVDFARGTVRIGRRRWWPFGR